MLRARSADLTAERSVEAGFALRLVVTAHLLNASLASWIGYLTPDSWTYLRLAKNLWASGYPALDHAYYAVFPFGYPALLALASPGLGLVATIAISKFVNAALWIAIYLFIRRLRVAPLLAAALVVNPFTFWIGSFTWSENLMLLAFVMTIAAMDSAARRDRRLDACLLLGALIAGLSSRYAFGLSLAAILAAYLAAYRSDARRPVLLAIGAAGALFLLYLALNRHLTGFATGMPRLPSTESLSFLGYTFLAANFRSIGAVLLPFAFLALLLVRTCAPRPLALMTGLVGLGYIGIIAVLRFRSLFDPFDERLIGPGWFLIALAIALSAQDCFENARRRLASVALIAIALWSFHSMHSEAVTDLAESGDLGTSSWAAIEKYRHAFSAPDGITAIVNAETPAPRETISPDNQLYYGDRQVFTPATAPFLRQETLAQFLTRLRAADLDRDECSVDFSHIDSEEDLSDIVDAEYRSGFASMAPDFDPAIADKFHDAFRADALVPCDEFVAR